MKLAAPSKPSPLLTLEQASKNYDGVVALCEATLELRRGEVHALIGENGAGKSTLIKLLAGVLSPDSMQLTISGRLVSLASAADAHEQGLRFIHQELNVVPTLSVAENIYLGKAYPTRLGLAVHWPQLYARARATLARLGITHLDVRRPLSRLSPGDTMLVSIARAFAEEEHEENGASARIYVMDEPTAALSRRESELLFEVIHELKRQGNAVLYVSHRLEEIFEISDRVTVMRDGRVVGSWPTAETTAALLIREMTGRTLEHTYPRKQAAAKPQLQLSVKHLHNDTLKDVSLELYRGEILGVAGLAGSGRSELLRALIGADAVHRGEMTLDGTPLRIRSPKEAWQAGLALVPEERRSQALVMSQGVRENVTLPHLGKLSKLGLVNRRSERRVSRELARAVQLRAKGPEQHVHQLSGGNQQKVVFARVMAGKPRVLLLDEPTRGVDVGAKFDIYRLVLELADQGTGVLLVSSDLNELLGICDRIVVMRRGQLRHSVATQQLDKEALLALCYGE